MEHEERAPSESVVDQAVAVRRRLYELRGELVSQVSELETFVDAVITHYFFGSASQTQFQSWVLSRLALASKIELLGVILREI